MCLQCEMSHYFNYSKKNYFELYEIDSRSIERKNKAKFTTEYKY